MTHYFVVDRSLKVVDVRDNYDALKGLPEELNWISNWDMHSFDEATRYAEEASQVSGEKFLPCDRTNVCAPRYAVIKAPKIGDPVSYTVNGDYYPCGYITKISDSYYRIETSTGDVFYRTHDSDHWMRKGGVWSLVSGHIDEKSREF